MCIRDRLRGEYKGRASAEGYTLKDGTALKLSDKDQKWLGPVSYTHLDVYKRQG